MPFVAMRVFNHEPVEITDDWGLRDLRSGMAYSVCSTLECEDCGVIFLDYRFSNAELGRLYKDYRNDEYNALRTRFEPGYAAKVVHYQGRAKYIENVETILAPYLPPKPNVLDWGGDSGINSPFRFTASKLNVYDISGVAVCDEATRVSLADTRNHDYDLVTCSQVLEHIPYPVDLVRQITQTLSPQTVLYLEVPLEEVFQGEDDGRRKGEKKRHWHEHVNFFSPASLKALAHSCDLEVLAVRNLSVSLGWRDTTVQMLICRLARKGTANI